MKFKNDDRAANHSYQRFQAFTPMRTGKRLKSIETKVGSNVVKSYNIAYKRWSSFLVDTVRSITECGSSECRKPTGFEWGTDPGFGFRSSSDQDVKKLFYNKAGAFDSKTEGVYWDLNADGIADFVVGTVWKNGSSNLKVHHGTGDAYVDAGYNLPGRIFTNDQNNYDFMREGLLLDINGDGLADYTCASNIAPCNKREVWHGIGSGFQKAAYKLPGPIFDRVDRTEMKSRQVGLLRDFNGDGKLDYVRGDCTNNQTTCDNIKVFLHTGNGFSYAGYKLPHRMYRTESGGFGRRVYALLADFNGDGLLDFSRAYKAKDGVTHKDVWNNTGSGFADAGYELPGHVYYVVPENYSTKINGVVADLNGDGLPDFSRASHYSNNGTFYGRFLNKASGPPRLARVSEGQGRIRDVRYMRLNDQSDNPKVPDSSKYILSKIAGKPVPNTYVVSSFRDHDGSTAAGYSFEKAYQYHYINIATDGRGVLGFTGITTYDLAAVLRTVRDFGNDTYPYNNLPIGVSVSDADGTEKRIQIQKPEHGLGGHSIPRAGRRDAYLLRDRRIVFHEAGLNPRRLRQRRPGRRSGVHGDVRRRSVYLHFLFEQRRELAAGFPDPPDYCEQSRDFRRQRGHAVQRGCIQRYEIRVQIGPAEADAAR